MPRREAQIHAGLRLADLAGQPVRDERLLSVRLPVQLLDELDRVCGKLGARKSEVVVALLNEGLDRFHGGSPKSAAKKVARKRRRRS